MVLPGKLIKKTGILVGDTVEYGARLTGELLGYVLESKGNNEIAHKCRTAGKITGKLIGGTTRVASGILGTTVDMVFRTGREGIKYVADNAIKTETRIYGEAEKFFDPEVIVEAEFKVE